MEHGWGFSSLVGVVGGMLFFVCLSLFYLELNYGK